MSVSGTILVDDSLLNVAKRHLHSCQSITWITITMLILGEIVVCKMELSGLRQILLNKINLMLCNYLSFIARDCQTSNLKMM